MLFVKDGKEKIKGKQKTIVYSSLDQKDFCEGAFEILSIINGKSATAVMEDLVETTLLPQNPNANDICRKLYSSKINNVGAFAYLFELYSGGTDGKPRWDNGFELIDFLYSTIGGTIVPKKTKENEDYWLYFLSNFKIINNYLNQTLEKEENVVKYDNSAIFANHLLKEAEEEPEFFKAINYMLFLKNEWDKLGEITYTYRSLYGFCKLLEPDITDSAQDRKKLIDLICKLSKGWN